VAIPFSASFFPETRRYRASEITAVTPARNKKANIL